MEPVRYRSRGREEGGADEAMQTQKTVRAYASPLARLERAQVTREMAKSLEALVQGELMQLKSSAEERLSMEYYLTKSYCKTASLMAYSCKSAALLSDHALDSEVVVAAEKFGYHFGLAFQARQ